jgi:hypothetical protein
VEAVGVVVGLLGRCVASSAAAAPAAAAAAAAAGPSGAAVDAPGAARRLRELGAVRWLAAAYVYVVGAADALQAALRPRPGRTVPAAGPAPRRVGGGWMVVADSAVELVRMLLDQSDPPAAGAGTAAGADVTGAAAGAAADGAGAAEGAEWAGAFPSLEEYRGLLRAVGLRPVRDAAKREEAAGAVLCGLAGGRAGLADALVDWLVPCVETGLGAPPPPPPPPPYGAPTASPAAAAEPGAARAATACLSLLGTDAAAAAVRGRLLERGLVGTLADRLVAALGDSGGGGGNGGAWAGSRDAGGDAGGVELMRVLAGLVRGCAAAQAAVAGRGLVPRLHGIQGACSAVDAGAAAQGLVEALCLGNAGLGEEVAGLQRAKEGGERAAARAQRERVLEEMRRQAAAAVEGMGGWGEDLDEDDGDGALLRCVICHEGYGYKPAALLAAYVFCRACSVRGGPEAAAAGRGDRCFAAASCMSLVHVACHEEATRAERLQAKGARSEWEAAALRNHSARCNALLPLLGPATPAHAYAERAEAFFVALAGLGRHEGGRFRAAALLVATLLERLAAGAAFPADAGGGSATSNAKLLLPLVQLGYHVLGDEAGQPCRQARAALAPLLAAPAEPQPPTPAAPVPAGESGPGRAAVADAAAEEAAAAAAAAAARLPPSPLQARAGEQAAASAAAASAAAASAAAGGDEAWRAAAAAAAATLWFPDAVAAEGPAAAVGRLLGVPPADLSRPVPPQPPAAAAATASPAGAGGQDPAAAAAASSTGAAAAAAAAAGERRRRVTWRLAWLLVRLHDVVHGGGDLPDADAAEAAAPPPPPPPAAEEQLAAAAAAVSAAPGNEDKAAAAAAAAAAAVPPDAAGVAAGANAGESAAGDGAAAAGAVAAAAAASPAGGGAKRREESAWRRAARRAEARLRGRSEEVLAELEALIAALGPLLDA